MAIGPCHCGNPCPSARDRRREGSHFKIAQCYYRGLVGALARPRGSAVRTVECPDECTVLMVVARQGAEVRRHRASPVRGRLTHAPTGELPGGMLEVADREDGHWLGFTGGHVEVGPVAEH